MCIFFFFPVQMRVAPRNLSRAAAEITIPLERRCCVGRERFSKYFLVLRLVHQVDGIKCLPGVGEQCARSLTDQQLLREQFCFSFNNHKNSLVPPRRLTYAWYRL